MMSNRMFSLNVSSQEGNGVMVAKENAEANKWHLRYGHLSVSGLKLLGTKNMVLGLPKIDNVDFCEGCVYEKQIRAAFRVEKSRRASMCLELIHSDLCGPISVESSGGSRYFMLFVDDYNRMSWVYFLKSKSEAFDNFKHFIYSIILQYDAFLHTQILTSLTCA
ncbi:retrovirus-related pol polyprotein from transposon TNT 1-94 [Tanacetum coccineum]